MSMIHKLSINVDFIKLNNLRHISSSKTVYKGRRPYLYRSIFRRKPFPYFKVYYDNDPEGPKEVITDRFFSYPPGKWGSMNIKDAWKIYDLRTKYQKFGTLMEKYHEMSYDEYNLFYNEINLPLLYPETLDFAQFITRTKVIHDDIPDSVKINSHEIFLKDTSKTSDYLIKQINLNKIKHEPFIYEHNKDEIIASYDHLINRLMFGITRSILSDDFIENYITSPPSKIESFFKRSGYDKLDAPNYVKDEDGFVKYKIHSKLSWSIRSRHPLQPFLSQNNKIFCNTNGEAFPKYDYNPNLFDIESVDNLEFSCQPYKPTLNWRKFITNCPGTWGETIFKPGDPCMFGIFGVINTKRSQKIIDEYSNINEPISIVQRHFTSEAVLNGFTWCLAQAQAQGYMIYDELTYPFCVTLMLTDGFNVQMAYYQLNSISGLWKPEDANELVNVCWLGPVQQMYEKDENGQVTRVNAEVIHDILTAIKMPVCRFISTSLLQPHLHNVDPQYQYSRDRSTFLLDFDPLTATEKQLRYYNNIIANAPDQPASWKQDNADRMWSFKPWSHLDMIMKMKKIVPHIDHLPDWYINRIKNDLREYELKKRGKRRAPPDAPDYK